MNFSRSQRLFDRAGQVLAGGVSSHFRVAGKPCPLFFERGEGSRVWDADGNEFIDYALGQGPMILGHSPPRVLQAVDEVTRRGQLFAGQTELEVEVAETLQHLIPCCDLLRFGNTGSEVVHAALRLARACAGRTKYVKFEGHYHGWFDSALISITPPLDPALSGDDARPISVGGSQGQALSSLDEVIVLRWNDADQLRATVETRGNEIAAIITEPIMCNTNCIEPKAGYLETMRDLCNKHDIVLIFDEVITGFRVGLGGAQQKLGVTPDLAVYAKAMAAGFPVSLLAGKREFMQMIADGRVMHAGTYNTNLMVMAATQAALAQLQENDGEVYRHLFSLGTMLRDGLRNLAAKHGHTVRVEGSGPMFAMTFTNGEEIIDYRTHVRCTDASKLARFVDMMLERGVRLIGRGIWYVSAAHKEADVEQTLRVADEVLDLMKS